MSKHSDFIQQTLAKTEQVVIFGLGREGQSSYEFLRKEAAEIKIVLIDDQPLPELPEFWSQALDQDPYTEFKTSQAAQSLNFTHTLVFQAPGIPLDHPLLPAFKTRTTTVTSNTQLFLELTNQVYPQFQVIGVTGTKGKSTTSSLIDHLLQTADLPSWLGGNIGQPALNLVASLDQSLEEQGYVVLELSSHQLDLMSLSPQIAVVQNVIPEHLDYYGSFERYQAAKTHITQFQSPEDLVIFNPDYATSREIVAQSKAQRLTFTVNGSSQAAASKTMAASVNDNQVWLHQKDQKQPTFVLNSNEIALKGQHNLENILPAVVVGQVLKIPVATIAEALKSFSGLEHRLELVATVNGVDYYNDSLATVPEATVAALEAFPKQPVILIAGGYDRGVDLSLLAQYLVAHPVKALVLFPTTGPILATLIEEFRQERQETLPLFPIHQIENMTDAVTLATQEADENDVVLLSPAAASFNLFEDYQDRGNQFKEAVAALPV